MSRLADYMNDSSAGLENYSDGETKLPVYDGSDAELHEAKAELAEAEIEQDEIHKDGEALREAQTAMEAYYDQLQDSLEDGGLNRQAAAMLKLGVEQYETALGIDESPLPSLESYGGASSQYTATTVSIEGIKDTLSKILEMLKKVMKTVVDVIKDVYHKITNATDKIQKRAATLIAAAKEGHDPKGKVSISGSKLFADGEFVGHKATTLLGTATYMYSSYPEDAFKYMDAFGEAVAKLDPTDEDLPTKAVELLSSQPALNSPFAKFPGKFIEPGKDNRFSAKHALRKSETLPNNQALYIAAPDMKSNKDFKALVASNATMKILPDPTAKANPKTQDVEALSMGEVIRQCEAIKKICMVMGKLDSAKVDNAANQLLQSAEAFSKKVEKAEADGTLPNQNKTIVNTLLRAMSAMQDLLGNSMTGVASYFVQEMTAYLAFYQRCYAQGQAKESDGSTSS